MDEVAEMADDDYDDGGNLHELDYLQCIWIILALLELLDKGKEAPKR